MNSLFDLSQEYETMLNQGIKISGEAKEYFIRGRIEDLIKILPKDSGINKILDYGCGIGNTAPILREYFKEAEIIGTDLSSEALKYASDLHGLLNVKFIRLNEVPLNHFDLVYVNGVFHHIEPHNRVEALKGIHSFLKPHGLFSFFENNPWNLGTRIIMSKIPFDADAHLINPLKAGQLLTQCGFRRATSTRYLFYFPRILSFLRFIEKHLSNVPLGAQYHILSVKKSDASLTC
ncbi:MAG: class I SAM-dependent methyltransferase [Bacteroidota bacterium]